MEILENTLHINLQLIIDTDSSNHENHVGLGQVKGNLQATTFHISNVEKQVEQCDTKGILPKSHCST